MEQKPQRLAISPSEAAAMIGISRRTLEKHIHAQHLPACKIGRRTLIKVRDLQAFLDSNHAPPLAIHRNNETQNA
jgi:excisionase family DNA binding protein